MRKLAFFICPPPPCVPGIVGQASGRAWHGALQHWTGSRCWIDSIVLIRFIDAANAGRTGLVHTLAFNLLMASFKHSMQSY